MGLITKSYTFSAGGTIIAAEHNTNFDTLYSLVNGGLQNVNCAADMGLVDTKLAQITTASKVSGTALTGLASIPATAGTVPTKHIRKAIAIRVSGPSSDDDALSTGDGKFYFTCPPELTGMDLVDADASITTASSSGVVTIQIARGRRSSANGALSFADMLSTRITIDEGEYDSANAATAAVINTSNDDIVVTTYVDVLRIDVDVAGTGVKGLEVRMAFQTP